MRLSALAATLCLTVSTRSLCAQEAAEPPAPVIIRPAPFASWNDEVHLLNTGANGTANGESAAIWWGLGKGATIGATAALGLTQAFCTDDDGCVGRSIGAILIGSLLGGALESGMDY